MSEEISIAGRNDILLPARIDELAISEPNAIYAEYPVSPSTYEHGFKIITYSQLSNAVNGIAWWLEKNLGHGKDNETLTYIGLSSDLTYPVFILGAVKAGYKAFLSSPRNSVAAHVSLLRSLDCNKLISSNPPHPCVSTIIESFKIQTLEIPKLDELLENKYPHYPYDKTYEEAKTEPLVVVHTSGSTGLPKPIILTHEYPTRFANTSQIIPPDGFQIQSQLYILGKRILFSMPFFHVAGICSGLISSILSRTVCVYLKTGVPPSAEGFVEALKHTKADSAFGSPSIIEEFAKNPSLLDDAISQNLKALCFAGGALPQALGDAVAARLKIINVYGATEIGLVLQMESISNKDVKDWPYFQFLEERLGMQFRHHSEDVYELVIVKDPRYLDYQATFTIFPNIEEFSTKDLFSPHPTKPGLWRHQGRSDDIIVFLNGEKTNPLSMEGHLASHPEVKAALVVGAQRFQAALLIELTEPRSLTVKERSQTIERLWPTISEANSECPAHARIDKDHVIFVKPEKPMLRAGKGTVIRYATIKLYEKELDELYNDADSLSLSSLGKTDVNINDLDSLESHITKVVKFTTGRTNIGCDDDLFASGMDSLQAIQLSRTLRMDLAPNDISIRTIYSHSSISALARVIFGKSENHGIKTLPKDSAQVIETTLKQFLEKVDTIAELQARDATRGTETTAAPHCVLLTGSTGALGSYLLHNLLKTPEVSHIFCLNRSHDSLSLQKSRNKARKLSADFPTDRVSFLTVNLSNPRFGLEEAQYSALVSETTLIIHAAWTVDFNLALPSFSDQLTGVTNLITLSATAPHNPSILYISSISSVSNLSNPVPEEIITNPLAPANMGYGQSKHIAERLLSHATNTLNIRTSIARVGQIAGPAELGSGWNAHEWLPSLVKSSKYLGIIPESLGSLKNGSEEGIEIDWVPIDQLANVLIELAFSSNDTNSKEARAFHPLNPVRTSWKSLLPTIIEVLNSSQSRGDSVNGQEGGISVVSYSEWVDKLCETSESVTNGDRANVEGFLKVNPALKLLQFYEGLAGDRTEACLETKVTQDTSREMRKLEGIKPQWMKRWVEEWML